MRLTRDEILLIVCVLLALLAGAIIKNYRDQARQTKPAPSLATPGPEPER